MTELPWYKKSAVDIDLKKALEVLDKDHFGLEKVKERIIEFLAVQKRMEKIKGPILCLVGPPVIRLTNLGIREVDKETIEASEAFGATKLQKLRTVQIPLALPTVFAGVNQTIMMALDQKLSYKGFHLIL